MKEFSNHCKCSIMLQVWNNCLDADEALNCLIELQNYGETEHDHYAVIFAHTFLGKYFIAQNKEETAAKHLFTAKELMLSTPQYQHLLLRLNFYLGALFDRRGDSQIGTDYYMEAYAIASAHNDQEMICKIYNNIAFSLECCQSYENAVTYYEMALEAAEKSNNRALLCCMQIYIVLPLIMLSRLKEAKKYIEKGNQCQEITNSLTDFTMRNLCCYYATANQLDKANEQAELIVKNIELFRENRFTSFDNFYILYLCMYKADIQKYALLFLAEMELIAQQGTQSQKWRTAKTRLEYYRKFEPQRNCFKEYEYFYNQTREYKKIVNSITSEAMHYNLIFNKFMEKHEDLISQKQTLELEANIDELTQVYNRRFFDNYILKTNKSQEAGCFAVIMMDIDYFKEYNDYYGHALGDETLKGVADCLKKYALREMYVCRYGGDEFVCLCDDVSENQILEYIHSIRYRLDQLNLIHEASMCTNKITLSIGYAICSKTDPDYGQNTFKLADEQLYAAKLQGRNTFKGV